MKKYLFYFVLVVVIGFILVFLSSSDGVSWIRARMGNKSTDYAQYMKEQPDGWHYFEAQKRFDEQSWNEALKGGTLAHIENYLKQNPEGLYVDSAYERIESLLWLKITRKHTIKDYEDFIAQNPDSQYVKEARRYIEELHWEQISSEKEIEKIRTFIETYPEGSHVNKAKELLENQIWAKAEEENTDESFLWYMNLYPEGEYYDLANNRLSKPLDAIPVYIDSYHLYELTSLDDDFGYLFENQIKEIVSGIKDVNIVSDISDAVVHLQIGYALSYREGETGEDNISKFIKSLLRDRAMIKRELVKPTFDIALQLYLWDISSDCLLAFSSSVTPPEMGNAAPARELGRDKFLNAQVEAHVNNSFVKFLRNLKKGKNNVMYLSESKPGTFWRNNLGRPLKSVCVDFQNGPISVYHWRDPSIEKYIYNHLQDSGLDCVRMYDEHNYKLQVVWSKYNRQAIPGMYMREYGLKAEFTIFEKDKEKLDRVVFSKAITSDVNLEEYGILPIEVTNQWRKVFDTSYLIEDLMKRLVKPTLNDLP